MVLEDQRNLSMFIHLVHDAKIEHFLVKENSQNVLKPFLSIHAVIIVCTCL